VALRVRNTGDIVEEYHVDVVGDPALWCVIEPSSVRLYPGTTTTVQLTFSPPRNSGAGPHPFGVRVTPVETPDAVMVPEGNLTVTPFVDIRAELLPPTVRGWRRAKPKLVVDNYGNTTATAAVLANGSGNRLDFDIRTPSLQIPPGRAHFSVLRVRPERTLWLGQKVTHPFSTTLQLSGTEPVSASGTYLQSALLPRWMARLLALLLALLGVFAGLWLAINPSAASDLANGPSVSATATVSLPASASPSASPSATTASPSAPATTAKAVAPVTSASTATTATAPNPEAWWKLDDDSSGGTASNTEQAGGPATLTNVSFCPASELNGDCAIFNGTNSAAVSAQNVLNTAPSNSFTAMADVKLYADPNGLIETMVSQDTPNNVTDASSGFYLQYLPSGNHWAFSRPTVQCPATTAPAQINTWTVLTGEYDSLDNELMIYVNGVEEGHCTLPANDTPLASGGSVAMGRGQYFNASRDWFSGEMNNVQLYNTALDQDQINAAITAYYS